MSDDKSIKWPQYMAALAATGGALAAGTMLGWTAPAKIHLVDEKSYGFPISDEQFSWIGSAVPLGAVSVCIPIGIVIKIIGRKITMLVLVLPFTIGWLLITFAGNVPMMIAGRFLVGVSGGAFCITAPVYTAEIAQKEIRGSLGTYYQLLLVIGILLVYILGGMLDVFTMSLICACIPVIFGLVFMWMPETPLYLVSKGKTDRAIKSLEFLRGKEYNSASEIAELEDENRKINERHVSLKDAFSRKSTKRSLFIILGLMFFQQACGINIVIFYATTIFQSVSSDISEDNSTMIIGVVQVVFVLISTMIVDRVGRRILLMCSIVIMTICQVIIGLYFFIKESDADLAAKIGFLPLLAICVFIALFNLGYGPIPWMMLGEVFATDIKGLASSIGGVFNWLLAFLVTKSFTNLIDLLGLAPTFWFFAAWAGLGIAFTLFFVPETKGKSLLEIQQMLGAADD